ncbi:hypothetical protein [Sphingomonas sp.]|uniref:hypothetical protein n=1 Tax=Sphingomonas sp. TaxID=28214 RepID=UPI003B3B2ED8
MIRSSASVVLAAFLLPSLAAPAQASTDAAWAASTKAGRAACIAAANLARPTVSAPLNFSDQVGRDAMLVRGRYKQRYMKNAPSTMLCLYDRRTHKAETVDAKGWTAG